jgi:hypothetical protein
MLTINVGCSRVVDIIQVAVDKLAVIFKDKICIYSLVDGSLLLSAYRDDLTYLCYIENKFLIAAFKVEVYVKRLLELNLQYEPWFDYDHMNIEIKHKLLRIDLNDFKCAEMNIEEEVTSCVYLKNGTAIFKGSELSTTWMVDRWPFERISNEKAFNEPAEFLIALSGSCFASAFRKSVKIWKNDFQLLHEYEMKCNVIDLRDTGADVFLIQTMSQDISFCNYTTGEIWSGLVGLAETFSCFQTVDKAFLVLINYASREIAFYHLNGLSVYCNTQFPKNHELLNSKSRVLRDARIACRNIDRRSIEIIDLKR